ncbi:MAG: hypothetical protein ABIK96_13180 [bacterium]
MKLSQRSTMKTVPLTLAALTLATTLLAASAVLAGETGRSCDERGMFIGLNAGFGGSALDYREGTKSISEEALGGALGGLRFGYAFNDRLALSLEMIGFGRTEDDDDDDWSLGAGLVALTWHPRGSGFFIRGGFGAGGGDFIDPDTDELINIRNRAAFLFGVGYDWRLSDGFSLGLASDAFGMSAGRATGHEEDAVGAAGLTIQCTWRL